MPMKRLFTNHITQVHGSRRAGYLMFISAMLLASSACARPLQVEPNQIRLVEATVTAVAGKDLKSLETILHEAERALLSKAMTQKQKEQFQSICDDARAGRWKEAEEASLDFLYAQGP